MRLKVEPTFGSDQERQKYINNLVKQFIVKKVASSHVTFSDKVDRIVAHKYGGLPIFFLVMWAVYAFSIEGLGGYLSGYFNDVLFGETIPTAV